MHKRAVGSISLMVLLMSSRLLIGAAGAAERTRPFLIGVLTAAWGHTPAVTGLRDGLRDLGYREDEQFVIGVRFTQGDLGALPAAARELVAQGVDLIFASGQSAKAAQMASTRIPIVFAGEADPLGMGLIQSFARPGGNITGVASLGVELAQSVSKSFGRSSRVCSGSCSPTIQPIPTPLRRRGCTVPPPPPRDRVRGVGSQDPGGGTGCPEPGWDRRCGGDRGATRPRVEHPWFHAGGQRATDGSNDV